MNQIASLSIGTTFLLAIAIILFLIFFSFQLLRVFHRRFGKEPTSIPITTFLGTISTAWALSLGFVAADIWSTNRDAEAWAGAERSAIYRLVGTSNTEMLSAPDLLMGVHKYILSTVEYEWEAHNNSQSSPEVEKSLQDIRLEIMKLTLSNAPVPLLNKIIDSFDMLQDARDARLGIGAKSINDLKWYLVIMLTVLSLVTISLIHAERPKAGRNAIIIFSVTAIFSLWILLIHTNPYIGIESIHPDEIYTIRIPSILDNLSVKN